MIPKDANRRRIYLMRHGSVTYFDSEGHPLRPDTVPLNALGREQAQAAGRQFAAAGICALTASSPAGSNAPCRRLPGCWSRCSSSSRSKRSRHCAKSRAGKLADIPDDGLRDAFLGALDGRSGSLEEKRFLGGESIGQLLDRALPQIDKLRADADWDVVLLVLHGAVNRALLSYFLTGERQFFGRLAQSAGCINAIDVGEAKHDVTLRMVNHSPLDSLQTATRMTTMEALYQQYAKFRQKFGRDEAF